MAAPGWYPDPGGRADLLRWWDGTRWSDRTRPATAATPDGPSGGPTTEGAGRPGSDRRGPGRRGPGRAGWAIGVGVVALVVLAVVVVVNRSDVGSAQQDPVPPPPSVSAWDETSSPDPSAERPVDCDLATADELPTPPRDGRTHGGPLSFAQLPHDWEQPRATQRFPFSRDSWVQVQRIASERKLGWQASAQVGVVEMDDYPGAEPAANVLLQCLMTSDFYRSVEVTLAESTASQVDVTDTPAVRVDALLTFEHPDLDTTGSLVRIIVVESEPVTYYFHAVPQETEDLITELDAATDSLQVD